MKPNRDSLGRRSRVRATSTGKRIRLTERDWCWLQALHRHGPLASSYLMEFGKSLGASEKRAKERLGDLFHEDHTSHGAAYLVRPPQQFQTIDSRYNQLVYDLAPAAEKALKQKGLWSDRSGPNGGPWWHKLMVSAITSSIELGCVERGDIKFIPQAKILERAGVSLSCPVSYIDPVSLQQKSRQLKPDALFGVEYVTSRGSRYRFFVVEADRQTEPLNTGYHHRKSISAMFVQYEQLLVGQKHKSTFGITAPILLLIVTSCRQRMENMKRLLTKHPNSAEHSILFQYCDAFGVVRTVPRVASKFLFKPWSRSVSPDLKIF